MRWVVRIGSVVIHAMVAMIITVIIGVVLAGELGRTLGVSQNRWVDMPYAPVIWSTALLFSYVLNLRFRTQAAVWVWVFGVAWFLFLLTYELRFHDPRWCDGCSLAQDIWNSYFTWDYRKCGNTECLGQVFGTTPLLNSLAYSIGAWLALRSKLVGRRRLSG
jgi:hypothetical protein